MIGTTLAHFEITEMIGEGGMGEVYRATDTKLDREVAIKVLPAGFAFDEDRRARFEREAKALASLSHPNIATVYGFEEIAEKTLLVMELLEGESLRERLTDGPLPARKAAEVGAAVARGLGAAHDRGIVHRDVKPENIFLTRDGQVKILDFGLATDHSVTGVDDSDTKSPTLTQRTGPGTVLGTVGYMAPEQVRGETTDARTDVFALGAVLYETVTGNRAFDRPTAPEIMTAILREEPPEIAELGVVVPPTLEWLIRRCLEKRPEERYQSARDLAFHLGALESGAASPSGMSERPISTGRWDRRLPLAVTAALVVGAAVLGAVAGAWLLTDAEPDQINIQRLTHRRGMVWSARFTPDAGTIVYGARWENSPLELFMARTDSVESRPLGLGAADVLAISDSGEMALALDRAFVAGWETSGTLATSSLTGAVPRPLLEGVGEADWGPDGESMAVIREVDGRYRLEYPIGTVLHETDGWLSDVRVRPAGDMVAFVDHRLRGDNIGAVVVVDLEGRHTVLLAPGGSQGLAWNPSGDEVWSSYGRVISATALDGTTRTVYVGTDPMWLEDIADDGRVLIANAGIRRELAGRAPGEGADHNLSWFDWSSPQALSSDGRTVLFDEQNLAGFNGYLVFVRGTDGSPPVRIGVGTGRALSPDGKWVLSVKNPFGESRWELLPTGPGEARELPQGRVETKLWATWLPDGERLIVAGSEPGRPLSLYVRGVDSAEETLLTPDGVDYVRSGYVVSPDSRWVTATPVDGSPTLFSLDGEAPRTIPGLADGEIPVHWSADGLQIFVYRPGGLPARVWKVDLESGARTEWGEVAPNDPAGVFGIDYLALGSGGDGYVYSYRRLLSTLYVFEGLK